MPLTDHTFQTHGSALLTLFDEVTELDYDADVMVLLHSRYSPDRVDVPIRGLSAAAERYTAKWLAGSPDRPAYLAFISPEHIAAAYSNGGTATMELQLADGRWYRSLLFPLAPHRALFCTLGITEQKLEERRRQMEQQNLLRWKDTLYHILSEMPGMLVFDYDPAADRMTTCLNTRSGDMEPPMEQYLATLEQQAHLAPESVEPVREAVAKALLRPRSGIFDYRARYFGPEYRWYRAHYASLADEEGRVYRIVGRIEDAEEQHALRTQARLDDKTGFLNHQAARTAIDAAMAEEGGGTLLVIDLDDFKQINDSLGHLYGDTFLKRVAGTIRDLFRRGDILSRFGGDEFVVFLPGVHSVELAERRSAALIGRIQGLEVPQLGPIGCSIGISLTDRGDLGMDALFHQADQALYEAKRQGKGRYVLYRE